MNFGQSAGEDVAACGTAIEAMDGDQPRRRVQLLKIGINVGRDGRNWLVENLAHASAIVAATKAYAGSQQLCIDYDHQTVFGAKDGVGGQAPAAGWFTDFEANEQGVWASVDWNAPAIERMRAKEYRYISPFFGFLKDGRVTRLFNAGLTNTPNFELPAVASATFPTPETDYMKLRPQLLTALGLAAEATDEQIVAAATEQRTAASALPHLRSIAAAVGLDDQAEGSAVATAVTTRLAAASDTPDPSKWSPKEVVDGLVKQVGDLTAGLTEDKATAAIDLAVKEGKLAPALVESWAKPFALKDLPGFKAWASIAPVILTPGESTSTTGAADASDPVMTAEDRAACAATGLSEEAFLANKKEAAQ